MNSSQETQLGHDLHRLASGQSFTPDLAEIKELARQRHHRSLLRRGATAAGAVVLAAGGLFLAGHGSSGEHGPAGTAIGPAVATPSSAAPSRSATAAPAPGMETVAYVAKRVEAALASVNGDIIRNDQAFSGQDASSGTNWTDSRTGNEFNDMTDSVTGKLHGWEIEQVANGTFTIKLVNAVYSNRTWYVDTIYSSSHVPTKSSSVNATSPIMTPAEIKTSLASGQLKIVGHRTINGHATIGLRSPWDFGYRELWIDSQTFLPVRVFVDYYASQHPTPSKDLKLTGNLTWLPRTDSLVNMVNHVSIPAGFTHVAPPQ